MEDPKTLFCSSKFPRGTEKNFFEVYRQFGHASSKNFRQPCSRGAEKKHEFSVSVSIMCEIRFVFGAKILVLNTNIIIIIIRVKEIHPITCF